MYAYFAYRTYRRIGVVGGVWEKLALAKPKIQISEIGVISLILSYNVKPLG